MTTPEAALEATRPARVRLQVEHLSVEERAQRGKDARGRSPRRANGDWSPSESRRDPVEMLEEQAAERVPELVPIRYGRMLVSPFTYFRGAAYVMAADLADAPRTDLRVQLCGDAHLSNFGGFASPDQRLVFDVNDFDETLPGPFEWDLKRLAASFAVAGRDRGFGAKQRRAANLAVTHAYRKSMRRFAGMRTLETWYSRVDVEDVFRRLAPKASSAQVSRFARNIAKARSKDSLRAFSKFTETFDGTARLVSDPPIVVPIEEIVPADQLPELEEFVRDILRSYRRTLAADRRQLLDRFRLRACCAQTRRRRQRRDAGLDSADAGPGRA